MDITRNVCAKLNIPLSELISFSLAAPKKYKVYSIPKRTMGHRVIAQPTAQLKKYQRVIINEFEGILPIHSSAFAYREKLSIKDNALQHVNSDFLLKMDFQNFFNRIKPKLFFDTLKINNITLSTQDEEILARLLFWKPGLKRSKTLVLSVGAPSSPMITNFVMYSFDFMMDDWCKKMGITYTRYADDITFSTKRKDILFSVPKVVRRILRKTVPGLSVNESKTVYSSKAHNRHITGVTITCENKLSLGRLKKRHISSLIYRFTKGELPMEELSYLKGIISFAYNIEPMFLSRMNKKYGSVVISKIIGG